MTDTSAQDSANLPAVAPESESGESAFGRIVDTLLHGDIALALGIACILVVLILPMPSWMLDIALAISMTF